MPQPNQCILTINADDFGLCHGANHAIMRLFHAGAITSASLMPPAERAEEAVFFAAEHPEYRVGVHLTLTGPWKPIAPTSSVKSLLTKEGTFHPDVAELESRASADEVAVEIRHQIEWALKRGWKPSHLDTHQGCALGLATGRDDLNHIFTLCREFGIPFKLPRRSPDQPFFTDASRKRFKAFIRASERYGLIYLDDLVVPPYEQVPGEDYSSFKQTVITALQTTKPGTTELTLHPAMPDEELRRMTSHWAKREWEYRLCLDPEFRRLLHEHHMQQGTQE